MAQSLKKQTLQGIVWSSVERFSILGIQFLVTLILANILSPADFGLVGMLVIFTAVAQSLIDSGFSQALIRKQKRTEIDNSTVFFFNIVVSFIIYLFLFVSAPWISKFYNEPQLTDLMRVLCIVVVVNSFSVVQIAIFTAVIDFKTLAKCSLIASIISGIISIGLAKNGFGVWALVWQQLANAIVNTCMLWFYSVWHPSWFFSWKSFRELFSFGSRLMASGLLDTLYNNIYQLVVGKVFSANALGHFTQAKHFTNLPSASLTTILQRVTYPVLCSLQENDSQLRTNYRQLLRVSTYIIFPLMCLLAGIAYPLVEMLIGAKWHYAATLIIPLSFSMMWYPVHAINLNLLKVKGRSDLFLRLEIIKKIIGVLILLATLPFGLTIMCWCRIVYSLIGVFLNTYYTGKLINMGFFAQLRDLYPSLFLSLSMFAMVFYLCPLLGNVYMQVCLGLIIGIAFYATSSICFRVKEIEYLKSFAKQIHH